MNFIIPQNYNFKNKFLGIIDYSCLVFLLVFYIITGFILHILISNLNTLITFFIIINLPITLICIIGINQENVLFVLYYVIKYFLRPKIYFYSKKFFE